MWCVGGLRVMQGTGGMMRRWSRTTMQLSTKLALVSDMHMTAILFGYQGGHRQSLAGPPRGIGLSPTLGSFKVPPPLKSWMLLLVRIC